MYAVTCGETKPPKQVLLSYGVKTLTGNVERMQILNRFGHGISYSQLEENDTAGIEGGIESGKCLFVMRDLKKVDMAKFIFFGVYYIWKYS